MGRCSGCPAPLGPPCPVLRGEEALWGGGRCCSRTHSQEVWGPPADSHTQTQGRDPLWPGHGWRHPLRTGPSVVEPRSLTAQGAWVRLPPVPGTLLALRGSPLASRWPGLRPRLRWGLRGHLRREPKLEGQVTIGQGGHQDHGHLQVVLGVQEALVIRYHPDHIPGTLELQGGCRESWGTGPAPTSALTQHGSGGCPSSRAEARGSGGGHEPQTGLRGPLSSPAQPTPQLMGQVDGAVSPSPRFELSLDQRVGSRPGLLWLSKLSGDNAGPRDLVGEAREVIHREEGMGLAWWCLGPPGWRRSCPGWGPGPGLGTP